MPELVDIISAGGRVHLVVSGYSMSPFLKHGRDVVCLRACGGQDLKRGQILLFARPDGSVILHRVRKVLPSGELIMNGDAQDWCETVSTRQVVAVVESVDRNGRTLSADCIWFRLWNLLWYPTRPVRPLLFKLRRILFLKRGGAQ